MALPLISITIILAICLFKAKCRSFGPNPLLSHCQWMARRFFGHNVAGCSDVKLGMLLKACFQTTYFRIVVVNDEQTVEVCGALKVCVRHFRANFTSFVFLDGVDILCCGK